MKKQKPWFKKKKGIIFDKKIPASWEGYVLLAVFLVLNFFSVFYFNIPYSDANSYLGFFAVLLFSVFVFQIVSKKKTQ